MSAPPILRWSIHSRDKIRALDQLIAWLYPRDATSAKEDRALEFANRVRELQEEFQDLAAPARAHLLMVVAVSLVDAFCFMHTDRRATEKEFLKVALGAYRKTRELVPLVKPAPSGAN